MSLMLTPNELERNAVIEAALNLFQASRQRVFQQGSSPARRPARGLPRVPVRGRARAPDAPVGSCSMNLVN
jgi:hypothetical protein